ncbi:proteasome component region PCI domain-containing protein [Cavenderia fasciculata]|uniref:Proteasome component region PCI domain-containing protein n=1 Tax=Cavenderia fasciculata TaxID=261658 RepID=F4Q933_CACFS|nr:proteasome component region PCI domain-containing protein [Cavenderia fasciculata]EGG15202.1 proteasome component region PCI domain-containing protein [Cavenderia fasciculata]|eukprot:XP_004351922.1 proteasome component region PCI domain-containing protein [Cavenderia fasciculata]
MELYQYFNQINDSIYKPNGQALTDLLSLSELIAVTINNHPNNPFVKIFNASQTAKNNTKIQQLKKIDQLVRKAHDIDSTVQNKLQQSSLNESQYQAYCEIVSHRLRTITLIFDQNYSEAFNEFSKSVESFIRVFESWSIPVMYKYCYDIRMLAKLATINGSATVDASGKKNDYYEDASRLLSRCFQSATGDRSAVMEQSKKRASLGIINQLFQIYFKLNNLKLCKNLIKAIESPGFPSLETYPPQQLITYKFFVGRLAAFEGNFKKAQQDLLSAFNKCPPNIPKNKKLILLYLIPMQLAQCKFPKKGLLQQYNLHQFIGIVDGMKNGNIKQFNQCLATNQNYFISKGLYLILEKLKIIVYRNLFKKIYLITVSMNANSNAKSRVPIQNFVAALKWAENETVDVDEAECIISNLIFDGYIKGYISHKVGLILSPNNPFPKLPLNYIKYLSIVINCDDIYRSVGCDFEC